MCPEHYVNYVSERSGKLTRGSMRDLRTIIIFFLVLWSGCFLLTPLGQAQNSGTAAFVVKPYLQLGDNSKLSNPEHLEIVWLSYGKEHQWRAEYKSTGDADWTKTNLVHLSLAANAVPSKLYSFSIELNKLKPGLPFDYRIYQDGQLVFEASATARKTSSQPYCFAMFGDMGANTPGQKNIALELYKHKPDFIVYGGDIVYQYGLLSNYLEKFFPIYNADHASHEGSPILRSTLGLAAIGNHDIALGDNRNGINLDKFNDGLAFFKVWSMPLNGPLRKTTGENIPKLLGETQLVESFQKSCEKKYPRMANYSFDYGNSHWLILDANPYMNWTNASLRTWVAQDLAKAHDAQWKFVCFHQPGFSMDIAHYNEQRMRLLCDLFQDNGVDIVFSGHAHDYQRSYPLLFQAKKLKDIFVINANGSVSGDFILDKEFDGVKRTSPKGVIYIVSGAGGAGLYGSIRDKNPAISNVFTDKFMAKLHSFTFCQIDGRSLTVQQIGEDGSLLDQFMLKK